MLFASPEVQVDGTRTVESDLILDILKRRVLVVVRDHHELAVIGVLANARKFERAVVPYLASHSEIRVVHKGCGSPARGNNFVLASLFRLERNLHSCSRKALSLAVLRGLVVEIAADAVVAGGLQTGTRLAVDAVPKCARWTGWGFHFGRAGADESIVGAFAN